MDDPFYGASSASGKLIIEEPPVVCDNILDDFNRPDGKIGPNWRGNVKTGHFAIIDEELHVIRGRVLYWKPTAFGPDQEACITLVRIGQKSYHSVMLKVQQNNYRRASIRVFYDEWKKKVGVETIVPRVGRSILAQLDMQLQAGDQLGARALADGTVEVYVNGVLIGTVDAGPFFVNKGGEIGLWFDSPTHLDPILDDFAGR
jgi:hypothetical protein